MLYTLMNRSFRFFSQFVLSSCIIAASGVVGSETARAQLSFSATPSQFQLTDWRSYTSLVNARAVTADTSGRLWLATGGGVFSVDSAANDFTLFRNTEGLLSLDAISIAYHAGTNRVYVGTFDGFIEIYSIDSSRWTHVTDIQAAAEQYPRRSINQILFRGDTAFLATDFGIALFDVRRNVFIETVDRIGHMEQKTPVHRMLVRNDSIFIASESGVALAPLKTATLRLPTVWHEVQSLSKDLLPSYLDITGTTAGGIYAMSSTGIFELRSDTLQPAHAAAQPGAPFKSIVGVGNTVYYCVKDFIATLNDSVLTMTHPSAINAVRSIVTRSGTSLCVLYQSSGASLLSSSGTKRYAPNTLYTNRVQRICADAAGRLWVATSNKGADGQGLSSFDGSVWRNYNRTLNPAFPSDMVWRISATKDSSVWANTWGDGLLELRYNPALIVTQYTNKNSDLTGLNGSPNFVLSGEAVSDAIGNTWILNFDPTSGPGPLFLKRARDGSWSSLINESGSGRNYYMMAIDASNTKWAAGPAGLVWYNENAQGAKWGRITTANSTLPDNEVTAFAVDKNGALWIGTATGGVAVMSFPSLVLRGTTSQPSITKLRLLRDQVINDILVDAQNNKWIATNTGVWVMTDDGADTIGYINRKKYPALLSDEVKCLAADESTGMMYIGGTQGLNSVMTLALRPAPSFALNVYPQPYSLTKDKQLTIDGLEADAVLHVVTLDGALVREINTTSRRAVWDGRDASGNMVNSGVYVLLTVSQANTTTAVAKILIER